MNEGSETIKLNSKELTIVSARLQIGEEKISVTHETDPIKEVLSLKLPADRPLVAGEDVEVHLKFMGIINDKMAGFYRSKYTEKILDEDGQEKMVERIMGATQFESTDARQAFPCWDEPALKSTFSLNLIVPHDLTALSNMDVDSVTEDAVSGLKSVKFGKSPIMSTYLVAWVIGDLEYIEMTNMHGVRNRVYTTRGAKEQGRFALEVGAKTLDFFSEYFGIPYPLPKMDMVAIPDFSAGAMENWGLVTYRTAYLLFDEKGSTLKTKQNVAYVVGHELAHQWFGNLVTMEWWSDLWLNEGFATWVGWLAADRLFPEWDIWTEFVVDDCHAGLRLDGLRSSHPIEVPVKNPAEISQIFDSISYSKGASVIRMLVAFLGEEAFQIGLQKYLKSHMYSNARTCDLWDALSMSSGRPVGEIMHEWTRLMGYPVLDVEITKEGKALLISQSRFLNAGLPNPEEDTATWKVPLRLSAYDPAAINENVSTGGTVPIEMVNLGEQDLLKCRRDEIDLENAGVVGKILKLDTGRTGFFRVNYPEEWLKSLGKAIEGGALGAADRVGLVSDAFAMSVAGRIPLTAVLDMLGSFKSENDYLVWGEISSNLAQILSVWWEQDQETVIKPLEAFIRSLYASQVEALGFIPKPNESDKTALLRPLILGMAARCGDPNVISMAKKLFSAFYEGNHDAIHPNLRGTVYSIVLREGNMDEFEKVLELYRKFGAVADQKLSCLGALGSTRNPEAIKKALNLTLDTSMVRPQDVVYITRTTGLNTASRRETWNFLKENWRIFEERYAVGGGISLIARVVSTATQEFSSEADAKVVEEFFSTKNTETYSRALHQSLERVRLNTEWLRAQGASVAQWAKKLPI